MIARLIRWSANNLMLILFGTVLAAGAGLYAVRHVPLDAIPDLSDTQVIIYTEFSGQAPQVVEDQVTQGNSIHGSMSNLIAAFGRAA